MSLTSSNLQFLNETKRSQESLNLKNEKLTTKFVIP